MNAAAATPSSTAGTSETLEDRLRAALAEVITTVDSCCNCFEYSLIPAERKLEIIELSGLEESDGASS